MPWESRPVTLNTKQRNELKRIAGSNTSTDKEIVRSLIILLLSEGLKNKEIAKRMRVHENTVVKWRGRWTGDNSNSKVADYGELTGRPRDILIPITMEKIKKIASSKPPRPHSRWTVRSLARCMHLPVATTQRALVELQINLANPKG